MSSISILIISSYTYRFKVGAFLTQCRYPLPECKVKEHILIFHPRFVYASCYFIGWGVLSRDF